jgi:hypothetical protein
VDGFENGLRQSVEKEGSRHGFGYVKHNFFNQLFFFI